MSGTQGAPRRGKGGKSARQRTAQVIVGVTVTSRELRTPQPQNGSDACRRHTLCEQFASHPQIHDAPVRLCETSRNLPSPHPGLVDLPGLGEGHRLQRFCIDARLIDPAQIGQGALDGFLPFHLEVSVVKQTIAIQKR